MIVCGLIVIKVLFSLYITHIFASMNENNIHWISQQKLADDLNISIQRVHNWIKRKKIDSKYNPDLKMWLVNPDSINIKTMN